MKHLNFVVLVALAVSMSGCWLVAAGAGAEGGYILAQDDRSAGETMADQSITASVKTKLLADSEVSGLNINVDTFKGAVVLKGVVDTPHEADKAIAIARNTGGVQSVESKLVVVE